MALFPAEKRVVLETTKVRTERKALILVVERDPHMRVLEHYFLKQAGSEVEFAEDGAQGLERVRRMRPHILITEVLVPCIDGLAVCRAIKSDPTTCNTRVLVFTMLSVEDRARAAGADGFLRKPLNDAHLIETVKTLLWP